MTRSLVGLLLCLGCGNGGAGSTGAYSAFQPGPTPPELHQGEVYYNSFCLSCHGLRGTGEGLGPALLDTLFQIPNVSDDQMHLAIERGVPQRRFHYGAMPPIARLTRDQASGIIAYVRWLQGRAAPSGGSTP